MAKPKRPDKSTSRKNPPHPPQPTQPAPANSPTAQASGTGSQPTPPSTKKQKKQQPTQPQFISIADAAKRLNVSEKTIRRWIDRRKLPAVRMGSQLRIPVGAFLHFIGGLPPARP